MSVREIHREETITHEGTLKLTRSQMIEILSGKASIHNHLPEDVWPTVQIGMYVPGGGDWSFAFMEVADNDPESTFLIRYEYRT